MRNINGNGTNRRPSAPISDSTLFLKKRRTTTPRKKSIKRNLTICYHLTIATAMLSFVIFQIYFLHQLEKYNDYQIEEVAETIPWMSQRKLPAHEPPKPHIAANGVTSRSKQPPKPHELPAPKKSLLPKHVITIFGPESSGTTFLSTTLGIATQAFAPEGKWQYIPGNKWSIPNDSHEFTEQTRWMLEKTLGRRSTSTDGYWEIQHLSLPWGWFCTEDEKNVLVEALVPEECWRYDLDAHVSPKMAESIWYGEAKRKKKKLAYYADPDNFNGIQKIPIRNKEEERILRLCREEVHITARNYADDVEWSCGAKCGSGEYDGFALYPRRFSVNISSHIEWYLSRGVEVTAILSARDRTISTKSKLQDHCKLDVGKEEDEVALELMTEALEKYGKRGSASDRERAIVVSYEGLMGIGRAQLFDLYRRLGINSTYVPVFADGNFKYVSPYKPKKQMPKRDPRKEGPFRSPMHNKPNSQVTADEDEDDSEDTEHKKTDEAEHTKTTKPPPKPDFYQPPPPKKNLLPKRIIAVFGPESSGTTFLTSVLGVATGAFPKEGKWTQILSPNPQTSTDPTSPRMKWQFVHSVPARSTTSDGEMEVQHLSLPSGWVCQKIPDLNQIHVVEAYVPEECMRYETLPDLDSRLAEQIWYNKHAPKPKRPVKMTDTVEDFDWEEEKRSRKHMEKIYAEQCREEVKISQENNAVSSDWSCGGKCGTWEYDGFALYPNRYFVNITSHIEWYLSRGVDITVVISVRDRSISAAAKKREHCRFEPAATKEDEMALSIINEAIDKYGTRGGGDKERVITVSYEAMMEFREPYLFDLYHQLGIESNYIPEFKDGNWKYVTNATKGELTKNARRMDRGRITGGDAGIRHAVTPPKHRMPPRDWKPRPEKKHVLPRRVITVVGPESSGTTLLATALGVATGGFDAKGEWYKINTFGRKTKLLVPQSEVDFKKDVQTKMDYKETVTRRVNSLDGVEVQHLSLPWGWICDETSSINVVEALVPAECFRYERAPNMDPHFAESYFWGEHKKQVLKQRQQPRQQSMRHFRSHRRLSEATYFDDNDIKKLEKCREEARISEIDEEFSCGAKCGQGEYDGFALYPQRFSINITSHIEWYLSRGVDITVIISSRDATIGHKGKLKSHCSFNNTAQMENDVAYNLISEALEKYGKHGSMIGSTGKERVITVSYEALMGLQETYLFNLYHELGISSTYVPQFKDGNIKYVVDPIEVNPMYRVKQKAIPPPKPAIPEPTPRHEFFLPRRLITVFSLDSSRFLSTSIAIAAGAFPEGGRWVQGNNDLVYEDTVKTSVRSLDGEVEIQHIYLPVSTKECEGDTAPIMEAFAPRECSLQLGESSTASPDPNIADQCKDEVFISEENDNVGKWTCGGMCGTGDFDGYTVYPERYFVNASSHIEWYTSRGVDVTAVLQMRDRSVTKKSMSEDEFGCHSRMIASKEDELGLQIMKEAYSKYGTGGSIGQTKSKRSRKGAERVIIASYEALMKFQDTYLFGIYQQLGITSSYLPKFTDENAKYIRTPPAKKKGAPNARTESLKSKISGSELTRGRAEIHRKFADENIR